MAGKANSISLKPLYVFVTSQLGQTKSWLRALLTIKNKILV